MPSIDHVIDDCILHRNVGLCKTHAREVKTKEREVKTKEPDYGALRPLFG
jgi:hypothetical protein